MRKKKQTAVQWLVHQLITENEITLKGEIFKLIELAKEMEREQIADAYYKGGCNFQEAKECRNQEVPYINDAQQYYSETFEK